MEEIFKLTPASEIAKYLDDFFAIKKKNILLRFIQKNIIEMFKTFESRSLKVTMNTRDNGNTHLKIDFGEYRQSSKAPPNTDDLNDGQHTEKLPGCVNMTMIVSELRNAGYLISEQPERIIVSLPGGDKSSTPQPSKSLFGLLKNDGSFSSNLRYLSDDSIAEMKTIIEHPMYDDDYFEARYNSIKLTNGFDAAELILHSIKVDNPIITKFLLARIVIEKTNTDFLINRAIEHHSENSLKVLLVFAKKF